MMKKIYIYGLFCLLIFASISCKQRAEKPQQLYSQEKMETILHDVYLLEGQYRIQMQNISPSNSAKWLHIEMNNLMNKYETNYETFKANLNYYMSDEEQAKEILKNATNQMLKEKSILEQRVAAIDSMENINQ